MAMSLVLSSTVRASADERRRDYYVSQAHGFLHAAYSNFSNQDYAEALECAYLGALRTAGAVVAVSPAIRKRKRLPVSAWERLKLTGSEGKRWADRFLRFSALRGHVASGVVTQVSPAQAWNVITMTQEFLDDVEGLSGSAGGLSAVA